MPGRTIVPALLAGLLLALPTASAAAEPEPAGPPRLDAASWLLIDLEDQQELAAHAPAQQRAIASTTKLMTAYLALNELKMNDELIVPRYDAAPAESVAGLTAGERLTVRDLIVAMMLPSANDAAFTVAEGVAGSEPAFVAEMNRAAADLDLTGTHYANPIGLDAKGNHSTAEDLATLAQDLLADKRFRRIVAMPRATLRSGAQTRVVESTNTLLLSDPSVDGVKTGHTLDAGYVLVASATRREVPLLAVVLGAPDAGASRKGVRILFDYGYSLYRRQMPVHRGERLGSSSILDQIGHLPAVAARSIEVSTRVDQDVLVDVSVPDEVAGPIAAGDRVGVVVVSVDGRPVERDPLVAAKDVPEVSGDASTTVLRAAVLISAVLTLAVVLWILTVRRRTRTEPDP